MGINIKNNFAPIIEAKDNATVVIGSDDAAKRYEAVKKVVGENIEDVDFEELPVDKVEELKKACEVTPTTTKPKKARKKVEQARHIDNTFSYKWINEHDGQLRLIKLYQLLIRKDCGWLAPDTDHKLWCALFMGTPKPFTLKWNGTQQHLYYLFKLLYNRSYIEKDDGIGQWEIVGSHFVNKNSRPFNNWHKQKDPIKAEKSIDKLAEVLNPSTDLSEY